MTIRRRVFIFFSGLLFLSLACNFATQSLSPTLPAPSSATGVGSTGNGLTALPLPAVTTVNPGTQPAPAQGTLPPDGSSTAVPTLNADPGVPDIFISEPIAETSFMAGSSLVVTGQAQLGTGSVISVILRQENAGMLAKATATLQDGQWLAGISTPSNLVGPLLVVASVEDGNNNSLAQATQVINLTVDPAAPVAVSFELPLRYQHVVAGSTLYFRGTALMPPDNLALTIAVRNDDCRTDGSTTTFTMAGSGAWEGFLTIPQDITGPVCALAIVGANSSQQRVAQVPLEVLDKADVNARALQIIEPAVKATLPGNGALLVRGLVFADPNSEIAVLLRLPDGRAAAEAVTLANYFGYWETELALAGVSGSADIVVQTGSTEDDSLIETILPITFTP